ncbi:hypothetical protein FACS1894139_15530 [Planctomycetales bacterium]|nr:hypothetical protein FACS1894107_04760 [Planctomycetales bacterium]GHS98856.1 hypothetical protein FACS1894108_07750 [Planctomycetales bacterium]GHT07357.1 hypothetical protein FACS1894139_15530 [Planctomycetales bacterium]
MYNTNRLFDERITEIKILLSVMKNIENGSVQIDGGANDVVPILKSNFLLMLYNLVEATVVGGLLELHEKVKDSQICYAELIEELQLVWIRHQISNKSATEQKLQEIIGRIINNETIVLLNHNPADGKYLDRKTLSNVLRISGNLDAKEITDICERYGIKHTASDVNDDLKRVKDTRNNLAHGNESFGECAREMTLAELEEIKNGVEKFIKEILDGMTKYCDQKEFLQAKKPRTHKHG